MEKYARIELTSHNPEIELGEWEQIAKDHPNIEIEIGQGFQVFGYLSEREYDFQMMLPDLLWKIGPFTGTFDDDYFESKSNW